MNINVHLLIFNRHNFKYFDITTPENQNNRDCDSLILSYAYAIDASTRRLLF